MNRYGQMAREHWTRWLPIRTAAIADPMDFFTLLGEQASEQTASLEIALLGPDVPGEDFLTRVGRRNMARLQAEEIVLHDLVLLPSENSPDESDETTTSWRVPTIPELLAEIEDEELSRLGG